MTERKQAADPTSGQTSGIRGAFTVSRRHLLLGTAGATGVVALGACGSDNSPSATGTSTAGTPKAGGDFRLGVTGGGSKDIMDG